VLTGQPRPPDLTAINQARTAYREALDGWAGDRLQAGDPAESVLEGLDAGGQLLLLAHASLAVAVDAATVAGNAVHDPPSPLPHWPAPRAGVGPWLGRVAATLRTHLLPASVWFRNSLRAALALGLAVLLTRITRVEHSFWVVLGTLSVLRSNALSTGRTALLAIGGTVVGFVIAAGLMLAIGTSAAALWATLPIVAFLAAYVPTAVSFLIGQAAFTLFVVVLFDLLQPQGWRLGLVRLEDIALGVEVSLVVAVALWPRGARGQLRSALAALYRADAACLEAAFGYLLGDGNQRQVDIRRRAAETEVDRAAAAFEIFLTERGSRTLPAATWARVAAAGNDVLLAADAMELMGLLGYRIHGCQQCADRIRQDAAAVVGVFTGFAGQLQERRAPPARASRPPLPATPSSAACAHGGARRAPRSVQPPSPWPPPGSGVHRSPASAASWPNPSPRWPPPPNLPGGDDHPPATSRQPRIQPFNSGSSAFQLGAAVVEGLHRPRRLAYARRSPIAPLAARGAPRMRSSRRDVGEEPVEATPVNRRSRRAWSWADWPSRPGGRPARYGQVGRRRLGIRAGRPPAAQASTPPC
jgi:hypothetical protein